MTDERFGIYNAGQFSLRELLRRQRKLGNLADHCRLTIIGQAAARQGRLALFPIPTRSAGGRLYRLFDIPLDEYLAIDRRNLIDEWPGSHKGGGDLFPLHKAKTCAKSMEPSLRGRNVIMMGRGVAGAFGFANEWSGTEYRPRPWLEWHYNQPGGYWYALFPHTSGLNRWWNDRTNEFMAAGFLNRTYARYYYNLVSDFE